MNLLMRFFQYLGRAILPMRLRPTVLQYRLQSSLERATMDLEKGIGKAGGTAERIEGAEPPKHGRAALVFRWVLHFLILGLVLFLLYWVNRWLQLERVLRSDWPVLHAYWLPILFLLLYLMGWLGWWIWELTGPEKLAHEFPDIDHAWKDGLCAVAEAGVDIRKAPLFLVVGRPAEGEGEGEENVLLAAQLGFKVREVPRWPEAPLRFSASEQAVFITCSGASVLGKHITLIIEEMQEARRLSSLAAETGDVRPDTVAAPVAAAEDAPPAAPAAAQETAASDTAAAPPDLVAEEQRRVIGLLVAEEQAEKPAAVSRRRAFLRNKAQVQEAMARLQHLCQLILRQRRPFCPVNGIMVMLPLAATDSDDNAAQATTACELDLTVVSETLQVRCPVFALACDAEKMPGFREFLQRIPASQRDRRMGQRFPLVADVETSAMPTMIQDGVGWFTYTFLPALVYNLFRLDNIKHDMPLAAELPDTIAGNIRLYRFLSEMRLRRQRLTRFLTRGLRLDEPDSFFFGGVFLAGTGPDAEHDRGFVSGVFQKLVDDQNAVAWTADALAQEADVKRWTSYGYGFLLVLIAALGALIYRLWYR